MAATDQQLEANLCSMYDGAGVSTALLPMSFTSFLSGQGWKSSGADCLVVDSPSSCTTLQEIARFLRNPRKPVILAMSRPDAKKNITTLVKAFGENNTLREIANLVLVMVSICWLSSCCLFHLWHAPGRHESPEGYLPRLTIPASNLHSVFLSYSNVQLLVLQHEEAGLDDAAIWCSLSGILLWHRRAGSC